MTVTKHVSEFRELVLHVRAQSLNSAPGTKMVLLVAPGDSGVFPLWHDKPVFIDMVSA